MVIAINRKLPPVTLFFAAVLIYVSFAAWLFWPHLGKLAGSQRVFLVTGVISASGVFVLGRRYVNSFVASFFAGVIYGFGPFASAFYCFHPFAFCVYAALPWTLIPAVFLYKTYKTLKDREKTSDILSAVLSLVPFAFVIACFSLAAVPKYRLIPIPVGTFVTLKSFSALVNPVSFSIDSFSIGFYHAPLGALAVGLILFFRTRRFWVAALFALAVFLSLYKPVLNVPPVFWLSFPVLIFSIICAEGFDAIVLAGKADANWLLLAAAALIFQAALNTLLFSGMNLLISSILSVIALVAVLLVFFVARASLAVHYVRMLAIYSTALLDVVLVTRIIIDTIF
jgi:hypothetical protein